MDYIMPGIPPIPPIPPMSSPPIGIDFSGREVMAAPEVSNVAAIEEAVL